jgi:hypothetical protein
MDRSSSFAVAAVIALAAAACAQTETAPDGSTDTQSSQRNSNTNTATSESQGTGATSSADDTSTAAAASSTGSSGSAGNSGSAEPSDSASPIAVGLQVQSSTGASLGTVVDVISDSSSSSPSYVVISSAGETVAVPYSAVGSMMHNGAIVMDQARLQGAPKVRQSQLRDPSSMDWQSQANQYWGSMRSARPDSSAPTGSTDQG